MIQHLKLFGLDYKVNFDLQNIVPSFANKFHFFISFLFAVFFGFQFSYTIGLTWDFIDGFKKYYKYFKPKGNKLCDLFREHFLYSDGVSFQDILFWDLLGAGVGNFVRLLLMI